MSTDHPLTDEQLDALVDEIQERLGDSTARTYGRRGVLAALGLATLGTGSASAQASGSVGTASSPVDVEGYDVTASNSFTDPAGVTHSGELADISDVGASGQWQEVNGGNDIEPIDGETIGTGTEDVDVGTVSSGDTSIRNGNWQVFKSSGDFLTTVDPSTNSDPFGTAQSLSGASQIIIPQNANLPQWTPVDDIEVKMLNGSILIFTGDKTVPGILFNQGDKQIIRDTQISGGRSGSDNGTAMRFDVNVQGVKLDNITFGGWDTTDPIIHFDTGHAFGSEWGRVASQSNSSPPLLQIDDSGGSGLSIDTLASYGDATAAGSDPSVIYSAGKGHLSINKLNIGANCTIGMKHEGKGHVIIDRLNMEGQNTSAIAATSQGKGVTDIGTIVIDQDVQRGVELRAGGNVNIGRIQVESGTVTDDLVYVTADQYLGPNKYNGPSSDVNNQSGSTLTQPVYCFGDGVAKISTGTGYDGGTNDVKFGI